MQAAGPVAGEGKELPELPRLVLPFNRGDALGNRRLSVHAISFRAPQRGHTSVG